MGIIKRIKRILIWPTIIFNAVSTALILIEPQILREFFIAKIWLISLLALTTTLMMKGGE